MRTIDAKQFHHNFPVNVSDKTVAASWLAGDRLVTTIAKFLMYNK